MNFIKILLDRYRRYKNPIKYWRKKGLIIGEECELRSSFFGSEPYLIKIGNHVRINARVEFVTHDGGAWVLRHYSSVENAENITIFGRIEIGDNVHIATNVTIMPNVRIGNNCIIGCGAIVTKDIPDNSIAVGIPARVIETISDYEEKNKER